jgi:hypothetical protein
MATLRTFEPDDAAAVAALFEHIYPQSRWAVRNDLAKYIREMFCANPWRDPEIPSWVAHQDGELIGFLGVMPRPMMHGKQVIRAAVGCQFLVHPEKRHSLAAVQLLRSYLQGPQDISLADGANAVSGKLWETMGGLVSPIHSLAWIKVLRPAQGALRLAGTRRRWLAPLAKLGEPLAALADACVARAPSFRLEPQLCEHDLDASSLRAALDEHANRFVLRPHYDPASLDWLLGQVAAKKRHGRLQGRLVRDPDGRLAGWFLYYLDTGLSRVMQLAARPDRVRPVLEHLFHHANERGTLALEGRMDARFSRELGDMNCLFRNCGELTLLHARDPSVLAPLLSGNAFFSRLEGEWWLRFHGETARPREAGAMEGDTSSLLVRDRPPLTSMTAPLM